MALGHGQPADGASASGTRRRRAQTGDRQPRPDRRDRNRSCSSCSRSGRHGRPCARSTSRRPAGCAGPRASSGRLLESTEFAVAGVTPLMALAHRQQPVPVPALAVARDRPGRRPVHDPPARPARHPGHAPARPRRRRDRGRARPRRRRHPRRRAPGADPARPPARRGRRHRGRGHRPDGVRPAARDLRRPPPADPRRPRRRPGPRLARPADRAAGRRRGPARAIGRRPAAGRRRAGVLPGRPGGALERRQARPAADRRPLRDLG